MRSYIHLWPLLFLFFLPICGDTLGGPLQIFRFPYETAIAPAIRFWSELRTSFAPRLAASIQWRWFRWGNNSSRDVIDSGGKIPNEYG